MSRRCAESRNRSLQICTGPRSMALCSDPLLFMAGERGIVLSGNPVKAEAAPICLDSGGRRRDCLAIDAAVSSAIPMIAGVDAVSGRWTQVRSSAAVRRVRARKRRGRTVPGSVQLHTSRAVGSGPVARIVVPEWSLRFVTKRISA